MDCFYAAIEMRDNPALRDKPIAVGGSADRRGVISTCNYLARQFGVRSAMASGLALKLCPDLLLIPGRMDVYVQVSKQIRAIFERYTDKIEPLSLDEAYLDVSDVTLFGGSATLIAEDIRRAIHQETGLTASAGVAPCKFVAKVASDENKPDGLCVITPDKLDEFVKHLPLGKIPGVGKVTVEKLHHLGLYTCADVRGYPLEHLVKQFGKFGPVIWSRSHGIDERGLTLSRERKSIGVERTVPDDLDDLDGCKQMIAALLPKLIQRLRAKDPHCRIASQGVKLKFSDFQQTTVEHRLSDWDPDYFYTLLETAWARAKGRGVRLVGLHVALPTKTDTEQLSFVFEKVEQDGQGQAK